MLYPLRHWLKVLIHTWRINFRYLTGRKPKYPSKILPTPQFVHHMVMDELVLHLANLVVSRRIDSPENLIFNNLGKLRTDVLSEKQILTPSKIPDMSLNIMGGAFLENHIPFRAVGPASENWDGKKYIFLLDYVKHIQPPAIKGGFCGLYINVSSIYNKNYPFECDNNTTARQIAQKLKISMPLSGPLQVPCSFKIDHVPTNLNYWHVQLTLKVSESDAKEAKSGPSREAAKYFIEQLIPIAGRNNVGRYDKIPRFYYVKSANG
jgi:hypothetical protein